MSDREKLRLALVPFFRPNNQPDMSGNPFARLMPHHLRKLDDAADAILDSDWLRDTLAAERERCAKVANKFAQAARNTLKHYPMDERADTERRTAITIETAIRNLAPKESDDAI